MNSFFNQFSNYVKAIFMLILASLFCTCVNNQLRDEAFKKSEGLVSFLDNNDAYKLFPSEYFPKEDVQSMSLYLKNCEYSNRNGKFVTDFYQKQLSAKRDRVSFIYEFLLNCDSIRIIATYELVQPPELVSFKIEPIELMNPMITDSNKSILHKQ